MDVAQIAVEYARTVSDGSFGSERFGVVLTAVKQEHERSADVVAELAEVARGLVTEQLRCARSAGVRRAIAADDTLPAER